MSHTPEELTQGLDADFQQVIAQMQAIFGHAASAKQGRATHTFGAHAKGTAKIIAPIGFPQNDFLTPGKTYSVIIRHSAPGGAKDNRARDAASASLKFFDGPADATAEGIHDIVMNTGRTLFVSTARTFQALVITPNPERGDKLVKTGKLDDHILAEAFRSGASFTDFFYHSQICYNLTDSAGVMSYLRYRLVNADRNTERGAFPSSWIPNGVTIFPAMEGDPRADTYLNTDFQSRFHYDGVRYLLQAQLRPGDQHDAVDCSTRWDEAQFPWMDLVEVKLTEYVGTPDLDGLSFNVNRTPAGIALPLATTGIWPGLQADNFASLAHLRALVYPVARKARADAPQPHVY
jgi:hypothetical protein